MKALVHYFSIALFSIIVVSCSSSSSDKTTETNDDKDKNVTSVNKDDFESVFDTIEKGLPIFYNMYLTVDMSSMFKSLNADYNPMLLNPSDNRKKYVVSSKKALNLGVYSVDLIYTRLYEKTEASTFYFSSMNSLASELRIPEKHFNEAVERFESNATNKDSLYTIANDVYVLTDKYLKENDREGASNLILLGGWIEAMYLASEIYDKEGKDVDILDRFADQKHSLEMIIALMKKQNEDDDVKLYLEKLYTLQKKFKAFNLDYDNPDNSYQSFLEIKKELKNIREEIIS